MKHARDTLFEVGIRLVQIAWRKARPDQIKQQDSNLIHVIYDLLAREDYSLAQNISDFSSDLRGISSEETKRMLCVNRALAYKLGGDEDKAKQVIQSVDWSASSTKFKLAAAVINDDFSSIPHLMLRVPTEGDDRIEQSFYRDWPLFKNLQSDETFKATFAQKFGEPLVPEKIDVSVDGTIEGKPSAESDEDEGPIAITIH